MSMIELELNQIRRRLDYLERKVGISTSFLDTSAASRAFFEETVNAVPLSRNSDTSNPRDHKQVLKAQYRRTHTL